MRQRPHGSPSWTRTNDTAVNSRVLYRLSYSSIQQQGRIYINKFNLKNTGDSERARTVDLQRDRLAF